MAVTNATLLFKRGTYASWASANPILSNGEPGYETDTGKFKVGNGTTRWVSLPYSSGVQGATGATGPAGPQGETGATGPDGPAGAVLALKGSVATCAALAGSGDANGESWVATKTGQLGVEDGAGEQDYG